jgi:hypothetical protein
MPDQEITLIAQSLIAAHGPEAIATAERAMANVRQLAMTERVAWWQRVVARIKEIEAEIRRGGV